VAGRILDSMAKPFYLDNHEVFVGASIGITICPFDGRTAILCSGMPIPRCIMPKAI